VTSTLQERHLSTRRNVAAQRGPRPSFDLLRLPLLGPFLRWRRSRLVLQVPLLLIGLVMVCNAFWGPQLAPKNLAALLTWVHFRGMVVLVALLAGNLFCMACPFLLPREVSRRWFTPRWHWPVVLRSKWPAIVLFVAILFGYELYDLWSNPWWTGALIVAYFALATAIDALFHRASFCKYVCPLGQFNFLSSTLSPLEVAVRDEQVCVSCQTKDCIRGARAPAGGASHVKPLEPLPILQRGCELDLFQPRKVGNVDCTFCLDCVYACPHDNVGLMARLPAAELAVSGTRSGLGRIERRADFTALTIVFTFGALLNALAMISPIYAVEQWIAQLTGLRLEWPILGGMFVVALVIEPVLLLAAAAWATRRLVGSPTSVPNIVHHFARSLVPIGFGVWLAHYGFHFFTGFLTVIPVTQNTAQLAFGRPLLGTPLWNLGGLPESVVLPMEIGFLSLGLLGSWMVAWLLAHELTPQRAWSGFLPWGLLHLLLYVSAVWIMNQPMDMRGTFLGG
jgi:hypothetical protein